MSRALVEYGYNKKYAINIIKSATNSRFYQFARLVKSDGKTLFNTSIRNMTGCKMDIFKKRLVSG